MTCISPVLNSKNEIGRATLPYISKEGDVYMEGRKETPQARYDKANTKMYGVKVVISTEKNIYDKLERTENKRGYIKDLIRADIEKHGE